jgi:hypothetical protein
MISTRLYISNTGAIPLMPNLTRRHVSVMDTSAKSTASTFRPPTPKEIFLNPNAPQSPPLSLAAGLRLRLLALPFAGGRPPFFPGGGLTNAKSTSIV